MTLAMATEKDILKIIKVEYHGEFKRKLLDMRIYKDAKLKVVKNDISGPLMVDVKGSRWILGRGQAQKNNGGGIVTHGTN